MKFHRHLAQIFAKMPPEARVAVAVSGGVDSVFLLHLVQTYCAKFAPQRKIVVLYLNHNTRGKESLAEQKFVQEMCRKWRVPLVTETLERAAKPTQTSLRKKRLAFFAKHLLPTDFLLLAHHQDDQAETLLFRLMRGVGVRGLRGMKEFDPPVARPLLPFSKAEILREANSQKLTWREDSSNATTKYERNWIRLELLPLLEERRPGVKKRLAALAQEVAQLEAPSLPKALWRSKNGWELFALDGRHWLNTDVLSRLFRLDRSLAQRLRDRIQAGEGKLEYRGRTFWVSRGFLLAGAERLSLAKKSSQEFRSIFGVWSATQPLFQRQEVSGDSTKKLFQEQRIPVFFRDAIPLTVQQGKVQILLNPHRPSAFARKFFNAIPTRDDQALFAAREIIPNQSPLR
jgi:tRNA(Ile)-lysidine synthetase-like protein